MNLHTNFINYLWIYVHFSNNLIAITYLQDFLLNIYVEFQTIESPVYLHIFTNTSSKHFLMSICTFTVDLHLHVFAKCVMFVQYETSKLQIDLHWHVFAKCVMFVHYQTSKLQVNLHLHVFAKCAMFENYKTSKLQVDLHLHIFSIKQITHTFTWTLNELYWI